MTLETEAPAAPLRIALVVSSMETGGAERVAALLCNEWAGMGHAVNLIVTYSAGGTCAFPLDERVAVTYLTDQGRGRVARLIALRREVRRFDPSLVISFLTLINVVTLLATLGLKTPVIVSERTYPPAEDPGRLVSWLRRRLYPRAHRVVTQTERARAWLEHAIPKARGVVVPNPLKLPLPAAPAQPDAVAPFPEQARIVLGVGRLTPEKGFAQLIDAFALTDRADGAWQLVILGEGPERTRLEAQARSRSLPVHLLSNRLDLAGWYQRADLFVLSSSYEGFPNALLEAMAHGLAVVAHDCESGPRELIEHGVSGLLVEHNDAPTLADAMNSLMSDAGRRETLGKEASKIAAAHDATRIAQQWLALI